MFEAIQLWGAERASSLLLWLSAETLRISAVIGVAALVAFAARQLPSRVRHAVWAVAVASVLLLPIVTASPLPRPSVSVVKLSQPFETATAAPRFIAAGNNNWQSFTPVTLHWSPEAQSLMNAVPSASASTTIETIGTTQPPVKRISLGSALFALLKSIHWSVWVASVWAFVAAVMLLTLAIGMLRVRRFARDAQSFENETIRGVIRLSGIRRDVRVVLAGATTPLTWGLFRPTIALPESARTWSSDRLRMVLDHELTHIRHYDCFLRVVSRVACALFWFHPLVWHASRRLVLEGEHACDDAVLAGGARPTRYAQELLDVARNTNGGFVPAAAITMARRHQLEGRVMSILETKSRTAPRRLLWIPAALAVAVASLAVVEPWGYADAAAPEPSQAVFVTRTAPVATLATAGTGTMSAVAPSAPFATAVLAGHGLHTGDDVYTYNSNDDGTAINITMRGDIEFNEDGDAIENMGDDARVRMELDDGDTVYELEIVPDENGAPVARVYIDRDKAKMDDAAQQWVASAIRYIHGVRRPWVVRGGNHFYGSYTVPEVPPVPDVPDVNIDDVRMQMDELRSVLEQLEEIEKDNNFDKDDVRTRRRLNRVYKRLSRIHSRHEAPAVIDLHDLPEVPSADDIRFRIRNQIRSENEMRQRALMDADRALEEVKKLSRKLRT